MTEGQSGAGASLADLVARGDENARAGYRSSRESAVQAYISRACSLDAIATATVDAVFEALFAMVDGEGVADASALDDLLLRVTRREAGQRSASRRSVPQGFGQLRRGLGRSSACEVMPSLLAARLSGRLAPVDTARMDRHLARCADCRALSAQFERAEETFAARLEEQPLPAPEATAQAPAPPSPAEAPAPQSGPTAAPAPPSAPSIQPGAQPPAPPEPAVPAEPAAPEARPPATVVGAQPPPPAPPQPPAALPGQPPARAAGGPPQMPPQVALPAPPWVAARRRRLLAVAISVVLIALVAVGGYMLLREGAPRSAPAPDPAAEPAPPPMEEVRRFDPSSVTAIVLDASGKGNRAATEAEERLSDFGVDVGDVGESPESVKVTTVLFEKGDDVSRRKALGAKRGLLPLRSVVIEPFDKATRKLAKGADIVVLAGPDLND
jgi:putative zinc finger protein